MADSAPITLQDLLAVQGSLEARLSSVISDLKSDQRDRHKETTERLDSIDGRIDTANGRTGTIEAVTKFLDSEIKGLKNRTDSGEQARTSAALALGGDAVRATDMGPKTTLDKVLASRGLMWVAGVALVCALLSGQLGFAIHAATQHYWNIP